MLQWQACLPLHRQIKKSHKFLQPSKTRALQQILHVDCISRCLGQLPCFDDASLARLIFSFFWDYGSLCTFQTRLGISCLCWVFLWLYTGRFVADCVHKWTASGLLFFFAQILHAKPSKHVRVENLAASREKFLVLSQSVIVITCNVVVCNRAGWELDGF